MIFDQFGDAATLATQDVHIFIRKRTLAHLSQEPVQHFQATNRHSRCSPLYYESEAMRDGGKGQEKAPAADGGSLD
jgi:hypothetical protein